MKKVIIIGASGGLAVYVIDELQKNSQVTLTLFLRDARRLRRKPSERCMIV
jgi:hypothetical protein